MMLQRKRKAHIYVLESSWNLKMVRHNLSGPNGIKTIVGGSSESFINLSRKPLLEQPVRGGDIANVILGPWIERMNNGWRIFKPLGWWRICCKACLVQQFDIEGNEKIISGCILAEFLKHFKINTVNVLNSWKAVRSWSHFNSFMCLALRSYDFKS